METSAAPRKQKPGREGPAVVAAHCLRQTHQKERLTWKVARREENGTESPRQHLNHMTMGLAVIRFSRSRPE
jgi:hypothetical protein